MNKMQKYYSAAALAVAGKYSLEHRNYAAAALWFFWGFVALALAICERDK